MLFCFFCAALHAARVLELALSSTNDGRARFASICVPVLTCMDDLGHCPWSRLPPCTPRRQSKKSRICSWVLAHLALSRSFLAWLLHARVGPCSSLPLIFTVTLKPSSLGCTFPICFGLAFAPLGDIYAVRDWQSTPSDCR